MSFLQRYRCRNCGHEFEAEILTEEEVRELHKQNCEPGRVRCPRCKRADVQKAQ